MCYLLTDRGNAGALLEAKDIKKSADGKGFRFVFARNNARA